MHPFSLPEDAVAAVTKRLGRPHPVTRLAAERTALVVIDMQNYFMAEGQPFETPAARGIVPTVNGLAAALRGAGGTVVWIHNVAPRTAAEAWPSYEAIHAEGPWRARQTELSEGAFGHRLWPDLAPAEGDLHVDKTRFSAFSPGASALDGMLKERGIDTLLIAGVATNICCETSARDAMMLNYHVVMVSDACAAPTDALHAAALVNFYRFFGDVHTAADLAAMLPAAGSRAA